VGTFTHSLLSSPSLPSLFQEVLEELDAEKRLNKALILITKDSFSLFLSHPALPPSPPSSRKS